LGTNSGKEEGRQSRKKRGGKNQIADGSLGGVQELKDSGVCWKGTLVGRSYEEKMAKGTTGPGGKK